MTGAVAGPTSDAFALADREFEQDTLDWPHRAQLPLRNRDRVARLDRVGAEEDPGAVVRVDTLDYVPDPVILGLHHRQATLADGVVPLVELLPDDDDVAVGRNGFEARPADGNAEQVGERVRGKVSAVMPL